ncbi:MAG TPA: prepilin-type N-terminal cleavage/methylation domain-containing protein [Isosphaeraceae bacterium]|jgi:prepilin-type N-terminal cleavage/methylation domain-containing protein|nr:prepilin-type N-terminal cleavage/methylation domain-containing protein [Isosphaeraceae bacterium]
MTKRRGVTLVELLVVISVGSVMLGLCVGMIHVVLRLDRGGRAQVSDRMARARLAQCFRADVRAALRTEPATGRSQKLMLILPEERIVEYRIEPGRVLRVHTEAGTLKNQDAFPLPRQSEAHLELEERAGKTFAGLVVLNQERAALASAAAGEFRVQAVLGKDHRFLSGKER